MTVIYQTVKRPVAHGIGWVWSDAELWIREGRVVFVRYFN